MYMKKIFLMAMVAVFFMACDGSKNGAEMPAKDKKVVEQVTSGAVSLVGQSEANIDKTLLDAGFVKIGNAAASAPKHLQPKNRVPAAQEADAVQVVYAYGITAEEYAMEDEAAVAARQNEILKKGNAIVLVYAGFQNDQLLMLSSVIAVKKKDKINSFYTDISDKYYNAIPSDAEAVQWAGTIGKKNEKTITKHDEFVAEIAAAEAVTATEVGIALRDSKTYEGFGYMTNWLNPDAEQEAAQVEAGYVPYVTVSCSTLHMLYVLAIMSQLQ